MIAPKLVASAVPAVRLEVDAAPLTQQLLANAVRLTGSSADAEDLLQETMLRAYAAIGSFQQGTNLRAWLYRIMRNAWIDEYRKRQRRLIEVSVADVDEYQAAVDARPRSFRTSAEVTALDSVPSKAIQEALQSLRESVRMVVFYADVWGFSCKEISDAMDIPMGTVASRLHRGRKGLRTALLANWDTV
ncbi:MAG TPA: sigma-70 family RNA polymerase sigma factor [Mycobacterium sp.]|jgi:RNA polymerase sigma-70 factor (ECF subfamily)|nr:sigma-70 family RNA polymerase sigma factor [Mycobacterium sp.]